VTLGERRSKIPSSIFRYTPTRYRFGVGRVTQDEIDRIQRDVSLERLIRGRGVGLRRHAGKLTGVCPFHRKSRPKLALDAKSNTWACRSCKVTAGTVVDWTAKAEGVSRKHAVELLRVDHAVGTGAGRLVKRSSTKKLPVAFEHGADDAKLLGQVVGYYHDSLLRSVPALDFLKKHGVVAEAIDRFQVGFADRSLGYRIPDANRKAGAAIRGRLRTLGILKDTGHETLRGCVTIPVFDADGGIVSLHGRRIDPVGDADILVGKDGLWNRETFTATRDVVVTATPFEAVVLWSAGVRNVTSIHGLDAPVDELLAAVEAHRMTRVTLAFPRTPQGDNATKTIMDRLVGVEVFRALLPTGMDVAAFVASASPEVVVGIVRRAEWIGGVRPVPDPALPGIVVEGSSESAEAVTPTGSRGDEIVFELPPLRWRVRGLSANTSYERLRVHVFASRETRDARTSGFHVDTLDLYSARQRASFVAQAVEELGMGADTLKRDLGHVLLRLEALQDQNIKAALKPTEATPTMTEAEREAAFALLRDPHLTDRVVADLDAVGVVGEATNKLVAYLATVSRKLPDPLAVLVQSSSAAGKTSLVDAVLSLVPEEDRVELSAMTGQALYYLEPGRLRHKVLSVAEERGASRAAYALKLLQSSGALTIASTAKEAGTGRLVAHEYRVEGPVALMMTTTATDIDEELRNRCIVIAVNETREQTEAIHRRQREAETLEGLLGHGLRDGILGLHRNAQRLLRAVSVVNPLAPKLRFQAGSTRARRDHRKYLILIRAIALLHQHQRETRRVEAEGQVVEFIEVVKADIHLADRLMGDGGDALDELPPHTRHVLGMLESMVGAVCKERGVERPDYRFTRREARERLGIGNTQAKIHIRRLVEAEYLVAHAAKHGRGLVYGLAHGYDSDRSGVNAHRSGHGRLMDGPRSGHGRGSESAPISAEAAAKGAHRSGSSTTNNRGSRTESGRSRSSNGTRP